MLHDKQSQVSNKKFINKSSQTIRDNEIIRQYLIQEIVCNVRDAVVNISGEIILETTTTEGIKVTGKTAINQGNGFFIKGHYIICPANLVLIPPSIFKDNNRIPILCDTILTYPNNTIRVSKILVTVSNVNGSGKSYCYEADIIGIDGAANIAILNINISNKWNLSNPQIINHPFLHWGKSRNTCPGDTIIVIGEITGSDKIGLTTNILNGVAENGVSIGNIADNRYVSYGGSVPGELLLLSNILPTGLQSGLPVITTNGTVIGMYLHVNNTNGLNIALSEFFMRRPVKALIRTFIDGHVPDNYRNFIEKVIDPINSYYRFNKSWLGLSGVLMSQIDYNTIITHSLQDHTINHHAFISNGPTCKEIVGYRVLCVASPIVPENFQLFIPGTSPSNSLIPSLSSSPLYGIISTGDIITHINLCPLGDRKGQISPALLMWRVRPGDKVNISYRKQSENFENFHEITVCTGSYEPFLDFPWYSISIPEQLQYMLPVLI